MTYVTAITLLNHVIYVLTINFSGYFYTYFSTQLYTYFYRWKWIPGIRWHYSRWRNGYAAIKFPLPLAFKFNLVFIWFIYIVFSFNFNLGNIESMDALLSRMLKDYQLRQMLKLLTEDSVEGKRSTSMRGAHLGKNKRSVDKRKVCNQPPVIVCYWE